MQPTATPDDIQQLRRCLRDTIALSALPAVWANAGPSQIIDGLAEILQRTLSADFEYVCVNRETVPLEALCTRHRDALGEIPEIGQALYP